MNDSEYIAAMAQNYEIFRNFPYREHYDRLMRISKKLEDIDNNEKIPYNPENDWSLGKLDGNWIEIDHKDHQGIIKMVWRFEGESFNRECQTRVYEVMSLLNNKSKPLVKYQNGDTYFAKEVLDRVNAELLKWQTGENYLARVVSKAVVPHPITAAIVVDDGGETTTYCVLSAFRSKKDAMAVLNLLTGGDE